MHFNKPIVQTSYSTQNLALDIRAYHKLQKKNLLNSSANILINILWILINKRWRKTSFLGTWPNQPVYGLDGSFNFLCNIFRLRLRHGHALKDNIVYINNEDTTYF